MYNHRINFDQRTQLRITLENIDAAEKIKAIPETSTCVNTMSLHTLGNFN